MIGAEQFIGGEPLVYSGFDGVEYIARCEAHSSFPSILRVWIVRTDGESVVVGRRSYPAGYVVGHGEEVARNLHAYATRPAAEAA